MRSAARAAARLAVLTLLALALFGSGNAAAISYTVQVAALSDEAAARGLLQTLTEAGYPAYLVSVPGEAQTVFRLRVGAFTDRDAAQAFATAMRGVGGTVPVPALAEGIPRDLIPLEPRLVARYPFDPAFDRFAVVPWGEGGAALRMQGRFEDEPLEPTYHVLTPELIGAPFRAWRAAPSRAGGGRPGVVERVTNLWLFDPDAPYAGDGALDAYGEAQLREAAEALGLTPDQVRSYLFYEPGRGAPFLVVAERYRPAEGAGGRYPALGNPRDAAMPASGPELTWFGRAAPEGFPASVPEALFELSSVVTEMGPSRDDAATEAVSGASWRARRDGAYTRLEVGGRSWRALVGVPLWASGDALLVLEGEDVVIYDLEHEPEGASGT
ncbi:SPOR domain-containing protein [Truepera radiovictrix]|nr:SPOR domain-containing protein [Truepera radiovictrix]WMT57209.1 SPOR domain-containing protein [Truepera radiovictrix]